MSAADWDSLNDVVSGAALGLALATEHWVGATVIVILTVAVYAAKKSNERRSTE